VKLGREAVHHLPPQLADLADAGVPAEREQQVCVAPSKTLK
jgi:hypothetical protein